MGEILITYRYTDLEDHMSEKTETVKIDDVEDKGNAYFRVGTIIGLYMKWKAEMIQSKDKVNEMED